MIEKSLFFYCEIYWFKFFFLFAKDMDQEIRNYFECSVFEFTKTKSEVGTFVSNIDLHFKQIYGLI